MKIFFKIYTIVSIITIVLLSFFSFNNTISTDVSAKYLKTSAFSFEKVSFRKIETNISEIENVTNNLEIKVSESLAPSSIITDVLETQYGTMSGYGLDCAGCSGAVGARYDAAGNNVRYYDPEYGECRIVAGDKKYPYGTIVRVVNSKIGTFNAIVLDRGGDIGIGRRYMFDLLFYTEAESYGFGLSRNTTFEILRYGY